MPPAGSVKAKSVALAEGKFQIVTTFGGKLAGPSSRSSCSIFRPAEWSIWAISLRAAANGLPTSISASRPRRWPSFIGRRSISGLDGSPLQLAGKTFPKGLAIPSRTKVTYKIAGKGKRLKALAGIDDSVREAGHVHLVISGDGKTLYDGQIVGRNPPVDLDLDVAGVKKLNILVDFGEGLDVGNYLDLCDARIVK